ncbi:LCP family protein [Microlunatus soli]|uniref:Cell envelope-related function transcriptional attenuator common domain-containing protein n=1 Tax=Microlunatus soli TaxID=630515 RepID=A0A1H1WIN4_9ACTN|nr:LCP family protein [Microlunatus soli]SDS97178.1 cell envelope-related function transcriptional attenuator common domain-containing protein [Microlunatus soli]
MTSSPRHATDDDGTRTPGRRLGRRGLLIGGLVLVPVAAFGGYQAWSVADGLNGLQRGLDLPTGTGSAGSTAPTTADPAAGSAVDVMLLGSDSRDPDAEDGRSDTIMLLHLAADRKNAYLISFPRDLWVTVPGRGKAKINSAYADGGSNLMAKTLNELTGIGIDHAAVIDFSGFADLTEAVGGVTVNNSRAFDSHGYHYSKGSITIAGKEALWFVRERHALPDGDFDRAANQRKVVKALAAKIAGPSTLANPGKLSDVIGTVSKYVTVDGGLDNTTLLGLAGSMKSAAGSLVTLQAPVSGTGMMDGQSVDLIDSARMKKLAAALQQDTLDDYVATQRSD